MASEPKENLSKLVAGLFEISPGNFVHRWLRITGGGAAYVAAVGFAGVAQTQTKTVAGSVVKFTFDPAVKVTELKAFPTNGATLGADAAVVYCVDPPNDSVAADWLNEANTAPREKVSSSDEPDSSYFDGATISTLYAKAVGSAGTESFEVNVKGIS